MRDKESRAATFAEVKSETDDAEREENAGHNPNEKTVHKILIYESKGNKRESCEKKQGDKGFNAEDVIKT